MVKYIDLKNSIYGLEAVLIDLEFTQLEIGGIGIARDIEALRDAKFVMQRLKDVGIEIGITKEELLSRIK